MLLGWYEEGGSSRINVDVEMILIKFFGNEGIFNEIEDLWKGIVFEINLKLFVEYVILVLRICFQLCWQLLFVLMIFYLVGFVFVVNMLMSMNQISFVFKEKCFVFLMSIVIDVFFSLLSYDENGKLLGLSDVDV